MTRIGFWIKGFLLLALIALDSCASSKSHNNTNSEFEKRFSGDVSKINAFRSPPPREGEQNPNINSVVEKQKNNTNRFSEPDELLGIAGSARYSSANVDTTKFSLKQEENFSPDQQTLVAGNIANQQNKLPDDMFDLTYNLGVHQPFVVSGVEFDKIQIPERDYYGIASTLNDKRYFLAGNQILQTNIDDLIRSQNAEDIELSEILIKEQRQLKKQQKLANIFGEDSTFVEKEKIKNNTLVKKEEVKKPSLIDEELRKGIALQIIRQNFAHNNPTPVNNNQATNK